MTFGKRLLLHLYTYKFFCQLPHAPIPSDADQSDRQKDLKQRPINKQQKMPHRPFSSTNLRCERTPIRLWVERAKVMRFITMSLISTRGAMYHFVLSLSPIHTGR
jgi:hypothetical protein